MEIYKDPYTNEVVHVTGNQQVDLSGFVKIESNNTWYVDATNGNDDNDGKSTASPKKTLKGMLDYIDDLHLSPKPSSMITINLAAGDYSMNLFSYDHINTIGLSILGDSNNPGDYKLSLPTIRGMRYLKLTGVSICNPNGNNGWYDSFIQLNDCWFGSNTWIYESYLYVSGTFKLFRHNSTIYGRILVDAMSHLSFKPTMFTIANDIKTNHLFTIQYAGFAELSIENSRSMVEGGTLNDFTGIFLRLYQFGKVSFLKETPKVVFPNCKTSSNYKTYAIPDDLEYIENTAPIVQPHNISVDRDKEDCHPIKAISGLKAELNRIENIPTSTPFPDYTGKYMLKNLTSVGGALSLTDSVTMPEDGYIEFDFYKNAAWPLGIHAFVNTNTKIWSAFCSAGSYTAYSSPILLQKGDVVGLSTQSGSISFSASGERGNINFIPIKKVNL